MAIEVIQAEYDKLNDIAGRFAKSAENTADIRLRVERSVDALRGGAWEGEGATAFLAEMDGTVFPIVTRLTQALEQAQSVTLQVKDILQAAEEEGKRPFTSTNHVNASVAKTDSSSLDEAKEKLNKAMDGWGTKEKDIMDTLDGLSDADKQAILNDPQLMARLDKELGRSDMLDVLEKLDAPVEQRMNEAMDGWGTDEDALRELTKNATIDEKRAILANDNLIDRLDDELSGKDQREVLRNLVDIPAIPSGKAKDGLVELIVSDREIDRNTVRQIANNNITTYYMEDLSKHPDADTLLKDVNLDSGKYTVYAHPDTGKPVIVQNNAQGFHPVNSPDIFISENLNVDRIETVLVHETNHAVNSRKQTIQGSYETEFRAYWVAEYKDVSNLNDRATAIKQHVLSNYPQIQEAYNSDPDVKKYIDNLAYPNGNLTNE